uniref:Uncharacterized protein n=1 Tax=Glossina austeni TaxID=7395 RepID=A0A1A9UTI6_GLOAU
MSLESKPDNKTILLLMLEGCLLPLLPAEEAPDNEEILANGCWPPPPLGAGCTLLAAELMIILPTSVILSPDAAAKCPLALNAYPLLLISCPFRAVTPPVIAFTAVNIVFSTDFFNDHGSYSIELICNIYHRRCWDMDMLKVAASSVQIVYDALFSVERRTCFLESKSVMCVSVNVAITAYNYQGSDGLENTEPFQDEDSYTYT